MWSGRRSGQAQVQVGQVGLEERLDPPVGRAAVVAEQPALLVVAFQQPRDAASAPSSAMSAAARPAVAVGAEGGGQAVGEQLEVDQPQPGGAGVVPVVAAPSRGAAARAPRGRTVVAAGLQAQRTRKVYLAHRAPIL